MRARNSNGKAAISRRAALQGAAVASLPASAASAHAARDEAEGALRAFLKAFENCDLAAMEAAFAPDAVSFDRIVASAKGGPAPAADAVRRQAGMPRGMRAAALALPKTQAGPPYQSLVPADLLVQVSGTMAVCTFHLEAPNSLGRRTIVLVKRSGVWKILHIHASTVEI